MWTDPTLTSLQTWPSHLGSRKLKSAQTLGSKTQKSLTIETLRQTQWSCCRSSTGQKLSGRGPAEMVYSEKLWVVAMIVACVYQAVARFWVVARVFLWLQLYINSYDVFERDSERIHHKQVNTKRFVFKCLCFLLLWYFSSQKTDQWHRVAF